eukprot:3347536-Prorocentrum_lima.AAC.1
MRVQGSCTVASRLKLSTEQVHMSSDAWAQFPEGITDCEPLSMAEVEFLFDTTDMLYSLCIFLPEDPEKKTFLDRGKKIFDHHKTVTQRGAA